MGDIRFQKAFERVRDANDPGETIRSSSDDDIIAALGGASRTDDLYLANLLATEAQNRARRSTEITASLGEGVIVIDSDWRISMQNPASERMLGWASHEIVGRDLHAVIHAFCNEPDVCHLGALPPVEFFYQNDDGLVLRKDGRTTRVAYTITPMTRGGQVDGGVLVLRDSSERKRQEEKSSEEQDRLSIILNTLAQGILTMDLTGRITYVNAATEHLLGRAKRDILERTYFDPVWNFVTLDGAVLSVTDLPFKTVIDTGRPVREKELGLERRDGSVAYLSVNVVPLPNGTGQTYAVLVSLTDITQRKRLADRLAGIPPLRTTPPGQAVET